MGRKRQYDVPRVTIPLMLEPNQAKELEVKRGNRGSRNSYIVDIITSYLADEKAAPEVVRARLEEGYCEAHKIAVVSGKLISLEPNLSISAEAEGLHRKTLGFINSVFLG